MVGKAAGLLLATVVCLVAVLPLSSYLESEVNKFVQPDGRVTMADREEEDLTSERWIDAELTSTWKNPQSVVTTKFTVASYNILAGYLAEPRWFAKADPKALAWASRSKRAFQELEAIGADIVTLQEVDHYADYWNPKMESLGYKGAYIQRPHKEDGCAIFWKDRIFALEKSSNVSYSDQHNRVGLMVALSHKKLTGKKPREKTLVVGTTHLHWDNTAVKIQTEELMTFLHALAKFNSDRLPTIVSGDFNNDPAESLYSLMRTMAVKKSGTPTPPPEELFFRFSHVYSNYKKTGKEPPFSTYKVDWNGWIDYIWYWQNTTDRSKLGPLQVLQMPTKDAVTAENGGLPNSAFPSDHLMIAAEFGLTDADAAKK